MLRKIRREKMKFLDLFPNALSRYIFFAYMTFSVGQGLLVKASRHRTNAYDYNTVAVVLLTDISKLMIATLCFFYRDGTVQSLVSGIKSSQKVLCLYLFPSFLYSIYNNLAFTSLSYFDPTSYYILLQLKVVFTGIIFQITFNKKLSIIQWFSLILLTCGCIVQEIDWTYLTNLFNRNDLRDKNYLELAMHLFFIFIQTLCSCLAGVYNEYLLKDIGANVNIFIQNIYMYVDSILWNVIILIFQGNALSSLTVESFASVLRPLILLLILNNSLIGITTSLFLKNLNCIVKCFASALEILMIALMSWIIFDIPIRINNIIAIFIVSYSLYVYAQNPVQNKVKEVNQADEEKLLEEV